MLFTQLVQWCGSPTDEDQALPFPRVGLRTRNGAEVDSTTVPELTQDATAEFARRLGETDTTPNQVLRDLDITRAGDTSFGQGAIRKVIPDAVMDMYPGPAKGGGSGDRRATGSDTWAAGIRLRRLLVLLRGGLGADLAAVPVVSLTDGRFSALHAASGRGKGHRARSRDARSGDADSTLRRNRPHHAARRRDAASRLRWRSPGGRPACPCRPDQSEPEHVAAGHGSSTLVLVKPGDGILFGTRRGTVLTVGGRVRDATLRRYVSTCTVQMA